MEIIRNRTIQTDDWQQPADAADDAVEIPAAGPVIVPLARLMADPDGLLARGDPLGVRLEPADDVSALEPYLDRLALVAIHFPLFNEGRGYSQARLLRGRYGFAGEIRAVGDVSRDRLVFMERCGINAFVLRPGESAKQALDAFSEISLRYQPAEDAGDTVAALRARRLTGAA